MGKKRTGGRRDEGKGSNDEVKAEETKRVDARRHFP
jgi:hypothetical protein